MRNCIYSLLLIAGFFLLAGLAGTEDLAVYTGQAGRPLWDLIIWGAVGCGMIGAGVQGLNRKDNKC